MAFLAKELKELKPGTIQTYLADKAGEIRRKTEIFTWPVRRRIQMRVKSQSLPDTEQIVYAAVRSYHPSPYPGRVLFFKPEERPMGTAWDLSRGWLHLAAGGIDVLEVPGDHKSMFQEPNVERLAGKVRNHW
jgi:thioesterase domain-containing protein